MCELLWRGRSGGSPAEEIFMKTKRKDRNIFTLTMVFEKLQTSLHKFAVHFFPINIYFPNLENIFEGADEVTTSL